MGTLNDWKNVEITMYWKVVDTVDDPDASKLMAFSVRGGPHHSDAFLVGVPCWGTALYVAISLTSGLGIGKIEKELGHPDYSVPIFAEENIGDIRDRWIGMKGIFYTKVNGNPFIELWLDKNVDNNWERVLTKEDDEGWVLPEGEVNNCHGERNEKITWGGPGVIFKLADLRIVDMKWASVREIIPPDGFSQALS